MSKNISSLFRNDPFCIIFQAFRELYPDAKVDGIWWEPNIRESNDGSPVFGLTDFGEDGEVHVFVSTEIAVSDAAEILAHELAHVAVGVDHDHDEKWEAAFDGIHKKYIELSDQEEIKNEKE